MLLDVEDLAAFAVLIAAVSADGQYAPQETMSEARRFDYLAVDSPAKRLYLSHGTEVVVIDTATNAMSDAFPTRRACRHRDRSQRQASSPLARRTRLRSSISRQ
jgi:hypothetical protein